MTKTGVWNIRSLNNPLKQKEVLSIIRVNCLPLFGIVEAKIRPETTVLQLDVFLLVGSMYTTRLAFLWLELLWAGTLLFFLHHPYSVQIK